jgi:hypothetical protein
MGTWVGILIAFAVGVVAYLNWMTAYQRLISDVFDRRFAIYDELCRVLSFQNTHAQLNDDTFYAYVRAQGRARFLFGSDVYAYLEAVLGFNQGAANTKARKKQSDHG